MSVVRILKKFRIILSRHQKVRIVQLGFLMLLGGLIETCSVSLMMPFMNIVMNPEMLTTNKFLVQLSSFFNLHNKKTIIVSMAVAIALIYIFKNVYLLVEYNIQYIFVYNNMFAMQRRLLNKFIYKPYEYYLNISSSEIIRIVSTDTTTTFSLLTTVLQLITEIIISGMLIITVFVISPVLMIIMSSILLMMLLVINYFLKPVLRKAGLRNQASSAGMTKWMLQSIQGIKELKVSRTEDFFEENYNIYGAEYVKTTRQSQILGLIPRFLIEAISISALFLSVAIVVALGNNIETLIPIISAIGVAAMRLLPSVNRISQSLASISYGEPMLDKLIEIINSIDDSRIDENRAVADLCNVNTNNCVSDTFIELQNISYKYPGSEKNVLTDANMIIEKGASVGIIGDSGSGKTTTIDIILGLLKPSCGQVLVNGESIDEKYDEWLDKIGYIPQQIFMLDDTIKANVAFGQSDIDDEKVWNALRDAALEDYVKDLPEGLDTQIGERGLRISGGQRQRLGIARALYKNPEVLLFDEATSALDNKTEKEIMQSINKLKGSKTMIIIAHRLTTIEDCDVVYKVEKGRIIKQ